MKGYTVKQYAELMGVTPKTICVWLKKDWLDFYLVPSGRKRITGMKESKDGVK